MTKEEIGQALVEASSFMKTMAGVANNAAWSACLEAIDQIRLHPGYRSRVAGGHTVAHLYKRAFNALKRYELNLIYSDRDRFFHVPDMPASARKRFGIITDREYYDFWAATGFVAYQRTRPFFTSLVNKLRLSFESHGVPHADIAAWSNAAGLALEEAVAIYERTIATCSHNWPLVPVAVWRKCFSPFSLRSVAELWMSAHDSLPPAVTFTPSPIEQRNVAFGYEKLGEEWTSADTVFGSLSDASEGYVDVFRTNGEMKKAQRQFAEMRAEAEKE